MSINSAVHAQDRADVNAFETLNYQESIQRFSKKVKKGKAKEKDYLNLGESYYQNAEYKKAAKYFEMLQDKSTMSDKEKYHYVVSLRNIKEYDKANALLSSLPAEYSNLFLKNRNYLSNIKQKSGKFEVFNLDMNTADSEFSSGYKNQQLIFSSSRKDQNTSNKIHGWTGESFLDLYVWDNSNGENTVKAMDHSINGHFHESSAVMTNDGLIMYFTRNNTGKKSLKIDSEGFNRLSLMRSTRNNVNESWSKPEKLEFNSDDYSIAHPALSSDESTLYFVSDMPGTKGHSDIFSVEILENGFGTPINIQEINTIGRETFPHVCPNGQLFFSSDGHLGLGGLDVFTLENNKVKNMGAPINSPSDDFGFILDETGDGGFVSSNREGGKGNDDIYSFNKIIEENTPEELYNIIVLDILNGKTIDNVDILLTNPNKLKDKYITGNNGLVELKPNSKTTFTIEVKKEHYNSKTKHITKTDFNNNVAYVYLSPDFIVENNETLTFLFDPIYYDLDKFDLRQESIEKLDHLVEILNRYPNLELEANSHTDSRASESYNDQLSQKRSQSTYDYLIANGIEESRIRTIGSGERLISNNCFDNTPCQEDLHQENRRTEFMVAKNIIASSYTNHVPKNNFK